MKDLRIRKRQKQINKKKKSAVVSLEYYTKKKGASARAVYIYAYIHSCELEQNPELETALEEAFFPFFINISLSSSKTSAAEN